MCVPDPQIITGILCFAGSICPGHQARAPEAASGIQADLPEHPVQAETQYHCLWQTPPRTVLGPGLRARNEEREHAPRYCGR